MRDQLAFVVLALPAVLAAVSLYWLDRLRRRETIGRWASDSGYRLLSYRQPVLVEASPFPVSWSKSQHVFRVEVEDRDGCRRSGWVRLGSAWRGLTSRAADVRWNAT
jgi:hypothetical protein